MFKETLIPNGHSLYFLIKYEFNSCYEIIIIVFYELLLIIVINYHKSLLQLEDPKDGHFDHAILKEAMLKTIELLNTWALEEGIVEAPTYLLIFNC